MANQTKKSGPGGDSTGPATTGRFGSLAEGASHGSAEWSSSVAPSLRSGGATVPAPGDTVGQGAPRPPVLDGGTKLGITVKWTPAAGEAVVYLNVGGSGSRDPDVTLGGDRRGDDGGGEDQADAEARDRANLERAARRARSMVRKYVKANRCTRLVTLTFAPLDVSDHERLARDPECAPGWSVVASHGHIGDSSATSSIADVPSGGDAESSPGCGQAEPPDQAEAVHQAGEDGRCIACGRPHGHAGKRWAMREGAAFVKRLRAALGGSALPYVLVPEYHADGHVHLHVGLDRFVAAAVLRELWPHGFVDDGERSRKVRAKEGGRAAARKAAAYLSKYLAKSFAEDGLGGSHRYEVGQGFQPSVVRRSGFRSFDGAVAWLCDGHGERVVYSVSSEVLTDYDGPPFLWLDLEAVA